MSLSAVSVYVDKDKAAGAQRLLNVRIIVYWNSQCTSLSSLSLEEVMAPVRASILPRPPSSPPALRKTRDRSPHPHKAGVRTLSLTSLIVRLAHKLSRSSATPDSTTLHTVASSCLVPEPPRRSAVLGPSPFCSTRRAAALSQASICHSSSLLTSMCGSPLLPVSHCTDSISDCPHTPALNRCSRGCNHFSTNLEQHWRGYVEVTGLLSYDPALAMCI